MLNKILRGLTDVPTVLTSAIVAIIIYAMMERNTFQIRRLIGGNAKTTG